MFNSFENDLNHRHTNFRVKNEKCDCTKIKGHK